MPSVSSEPDVCVPPGLTWSLAGTTQPVENAYYNQNGFQTAFIKTDSKFYSKYYEKLYPKFIKIDIEGSNKLNKNNIYVVYNAYKLKKIDNSNMEYYDVI